MGLITSFPGGNGGSALPSGGTTGQVLAKNSDTDGDAKWSDPVNTEDFYETMDTEYNTISDNEYVPFRGPADSDKKGRILWSAIKSNLKGYFDTIYSLITTSKAAASGGTDLSLVTTGEKYNWNNPSVPIVANQFDKANIYSTTEKIVGCWTDGRPVYQKAITGTITTTADWNSFNHGVSNISNARIVSGFVYTTTVESTWWNDGGYKASGALDMFIVTPSAVKVFAGSAMIGGSIVAILQYTKTTDAANSFKYADENDYSTTEHIVGTWIDGKPLYQKTFSGTLTKSAPYVINVRTEISNLKHLIIKNATSVAPNGKFVAIPGYISKGANYMIDITPDTTTETVTVTVTGSSSTFTVYVTLQYTKTTD